VSYDRALYQMYLARVPMFHTCSEEQLDLLAHLGSAVSVAEGDDVFRQGDVGDGFYVIASGAATVERDGAVVAELAAGDFFGELSLFDPAPRNATVRASEDLSCVMLTPTAFGEALDRIPAIRHAILHGMAVRIHEVDRRH
jgi:CRP/FNR family cyclic AMP-dependent transcriptional regulator